MNAKLMSSLIALILATASVSALSTDEARNLCQDTGNDLVGAIVSWDGTSFVTAIDRFDINPDVSGSNIRAEYSTDLRVKTIIALDGDSLQIIAPSSNSGTISANSGLTDLVFCLDNTEGAKDSRSKAKTKDESSTRTSISSVESEDSQIEAVEVPEFSTIAASLLAISLLGLIFYRRN